MIRDLARTLGYIGLSDRLDSGPGQITLHAYQKELLQYVKDGKNVAIFLPTGTGKTFIVFKYVQVRTLIGRVVVCLFVSIPPTFTR